MDWGEQALLFGELPDHLQQKTLFKVNTGTREQEVCGLKWQHEVHIVELNISIFVIPAEDTKNGEERIVVLNSVAREVIEAQRGKHDVWVFPYKGNRVTRMYNSAWKSARKRAASKYEGKAPWGFRNVRVHDLKHTFGRRLRAAGVSLEDRKDLLGHKSSEITTHYSAPEIANLIEAAEKVCMGDSRKTPALTLVRVKRDT